MIIVFKILMVSFSEYFLILYGSILTDFFHLFQFFPEIIAYIFFLFFLFYGHFIYKLHLTSPLYYPLFIKEYVISSINSLLIVELIELIFLYYLIFHLDI